MARLYHVPLSPFCRKVRLVLNVSKVQQNRSWIEVEVIEEKTDRPLPGFGREDCFRVGWSFVFVCLGGSGGGFGRLRR